jgi:hypothetical protein
MALFSAISRSGNRACVVFCVLLLSSVTGCGRGAEPPRAVLSQKRVEFSILEDYDKGEDLAEIAKDFDLFRELGVTTWRGSFGWDDFEPSRGAYDFEWLHRFADLAATRGITLRPYIGYTPDWAAAGGSDAETWNDPPREIEDWHRFARTLAGEMRRHRNIVSYEIYNEENVRQWWDGSPAAYAETLRRGAAAIEAGNPEAQVLLGGMVYADIDWVETVCGDQENRRLLDVIPFHAYPETWTPPDVTLESYLGPGFTKDFVAAADSACGLKPMWINETGYATTPGRTELDQARWWTRAVATFVAQPRIEHIGIYEIKDLRPDKAAIGDAPNYHLGLTRVNREKKVAFATVARLVKLLGGHGITVDTPQVAVTAASDATVHRQLFTREDGRQVLFLWTRDAESVVHVSLRADAARIVEYSVDGQPAGESILLEDRLQKLVLRTDEPRVFEIVPR